MQDIVVGNKTLTDMAKPREIVQLLLNDEQLASLDKSGGLAAAEQSNTNKGKQTGKKRANGDGDEGGMGDLWNDDGDDFFGSGGGANQDDDENNGAGAAPKKRRKNANAGAPKGPRKGKKAVVAANGTGDSTPIDVVVDF